MDELYHRVTECVEQIKAVNNRLARRDLLRMLRTVDSALNELDSERVECRRLNRNTARYQQLESRALELIVNLEQHLTLARLMFI
jgi:hypothetical protein